MTLVAVGPPKRCNGCGCVKPRSAFYARRADGGVYAQSRCKECMRTRGGNATYSKIYRDRLRQDPEAMAIYRDKQRERERRRRGSRTRRIPNYIESSESLPVAPFAAWLRYVMERDEATGVDTARRLGMANRWFRSILNGEQQTVQLATVERSLTLDGTHLREVYPDWYSEAA